MISLGVWALVATSAATVAYLPLASRLQMLDAPNHRSAHRLVTPSSGGLAIIVGVVSVLLVAMLTDRWAPGAGASVMLALLVALCVLGAWDDRRSIPVALRMVLFLGLASIAILQYFDATSLPLWLPPLLVLALSWLFNLYNFMDGIDGLAALQCVVVASAMLALGSISGAPSAFLGLTAVVAGAHAGFLLFNWPPARLFMGDAGSLSAGLLLGWLGLWSWRDQILPATVWLLLMSPFLLDTGLTLLARALRRERLTEAHSGHVYQRLARHWGSHRRVDIALLVLHLTWLIPLSALACLSPVPKWTLLAIGLFPQLLLIAKCQRLK